MKAFIASVPVSLVPFAAAAGPAGGAAGDGLLVGFVHCTDVH